MTTFEVINITVAYRVRISWANGRESFIGDYPTKRIAAAEAARWIEREESRS